MRKSNSYSKRSSAAEDLSSIRANPDILGMVWGFIPWVVASLKHIFPYVAILDGP